MPWQTPTLEQLRALNASNIVAQLRSGPMVPNSVLRVMADSNAGLGYLCLLYLNWLALQLMPDTAETIWLDRFGTIWVGGRKAASFASATATASGINGTILPAGTQASISTTSGPILIQTTQEITIGLGATPVSIIALSAGETGVQVGTVLNLVVGVSGVNSSLIVTTIDDGVDAETDDELRARVLDRIREPPMGGDASDYVQWALDVPGVTRAWCSPNEQGIGTITVRFMMDDKNNGPFYIDTNGNGHGAGFPEDDDVANVLAYLETVRPVAIKDFFVAAPLPQLINFTINNLDEDNAATQAAIATSVTQMLTDNAMPASAVNGVGQSATTIFAAWVSQAIMQASGVVSFDLVMTDTAPTSNGSLAVLGTITYGS